MQNNQSTRCGMLFLCVVLFLPCPSPGQKKRRRLSPQEMAQVRANAEEAKQQFLAGRGAFRSGDYKSALAYFKNAVMRAPRTAEYRYHLALTYEQLKQPGDAWFQLRQAVLVNQYHRLATERFLFYWTTLNESGALDVGKSGDQVKKRVGKPDKIVKQKDRQRWMYAFMCVNLQGGQVYSVMNMRGISEKALAPADVPDIKLKSSNWTLKHRSLSSRRVEITYVHKQSTKTTQTRLIVQRMIDEMGSQPKMPDTLKRLETALKKSAPKLLWSVADANERDARYECRVPAQGKRPPVHQLAKVLFGKNDIHRVAIVRRGGMFSDTENKWYTGILAKVKLISPR